MISKNGLSIDTFYKKNCFEDSRLVLGKFLMCTICMVFWMLVGTRYRTVSGQTIDPFGWIVTGLVGGLMASSSMQIS